MYKDFDLQEGYNVAQDINFVILCSGKQKVKYRIHSKNPSLPLTVKVYSLDNRNKSLKSVNILEYNKTVAIPLSGVYEEEFSFETRVPYDNAGWSRGQDLRKFDRKELESAVVAFYQKMWHIYKDKSRKDDLFPLIFEREKETAISKYFTEKEIKEIKEEYLLPYTNKTYELLPLKDYKMVFYAEGKGVALEQTSTAIQLRGYSALGAKYTTEKGSVLGDMHQMILYLPEGKNLKDGLQIIR